MMLPMFQNRKVHFPEELRTNNDLMELMEQLRGATYSGFTSKFIDGADCVSLINAMDVQYPAPVTYRKRRSEQEIMEDRYLDRIIASDEPEVDAFSSYV